MFWCRRNIRCTSFRDATMRFGTRLIAGIAICVCLGVSDVLRAQDNAKGKEEPSAPSSSAASAPVPITVDELEGTVLTGLIHYANRVRRDGTTLSGTADWRFRIEIGAKGVMRVVVNWQAQFPGKNPPPQHFSNVETIGVPITKRDQDGARSVLWLLENDTLTLLRVYDAGGRRIDFKLARAGESFTCGVKSGFMTEDDKLRPRIAGWEVLERRDLRTTCKAMKVKR